MLSLFVNPAQFADAADLDGYPRDEARDAAARGARQASTSLFAPPAEEMYPPGFQTWVDVTDRRRDASRASTGRATSAASRPSA